MNINLKNMSFVEFNKQIMNWVKFNGQLVYEAWKKLTKSGIPPLSIFSKGEDLIDYKIYGNTTQNGIPTPQTPIDVESIGIASKNILNPDIGKTTYSGYRYTALEVSSQPLTISMKDKDTSIDLTGISFGFTGSGSNSAGGYNWLVSNGRIMKTETTNTIHNNGTSVADNPYMYFSVHPTTEETWNAVFERFDVQIEKGTAASEYEPYGYSIPVKVNDVITNILLNEPLRKIGNDVDYIDFENKKVFRKIEKLVFSGKTSERWTLQAEGVCAFYCNGIDSGYSSSNAVDNICYCNLFTHNKQSDLFLGAIGIGFRGGTTRRMYITFGADSEINTVEALREWLSNNVLEVVFLSDTPTEETIELPNIPTYKGINTIEVDTSIQPSNMEVTYLGKPMIDSELSEEEIKAINNMSISNDENGLFINYSDDVLAIDFDINDNNLIVTNHTSANFSINGDGEMEVEY